MWKILNETSYKILNGFSGFLWEYELRNPETKNLSEKGNTYLFCIMTLIDVFISLKSFIFHYSHCRVSHASRWCHFWSYNRVVWMPATVIQGRFFFIFFRWQFMKTQLQLILQKSSILMNMQWSYLLPSELWHSSHEIVIQRKCEESILSFLFKQTFMINYDVENTVYYNSLFP